MGRAIEAGMVGALAAGLRGTVLRPDESGYDEARRGWNATVDRRPALIVRAAGAADVIQSVKFARDHGLLLAVRGGGHNIAGNAVCDDGLVIDLSGMRGVRVDPRARRAQVDPGALLSDFDKEAQAFGLATPLGINSTTGVAGLTLGGGFGWLTRAHGMTVDNLVSADVVTADGALLRASAEENADLFWALRGGGGNYTTYRVGDGMAAGMCALEAGAGMPPHWGCYIAVADAAATCAQVTAAGGTVVAEPFAMGDMGTAAVIRDPTGAHFRLWQAAAPMSAPRLPHDAVGAACWNELLTPNADRAIGFYARVFGWKPEVMQMPGRQYVVCAIGEQQVAGIMQLNDDMKKMHVPTMWMVYFNVTDRDATIALATQAGGRAISPPLEAPEVGKFVTLQDPQGAVFGVISP